MINMLEEVRRRFLLQNEYLGDNKLINRVTPSLSVSVSAYQHVNFIKQCLDSILMQKTTFPFEIIVGEDDSNDGTREICMEYAQKHPDKIRLFLRDRKLSQLLDEKGNVVKRLNGVLTFGYLSCRGKYIALCEGDDYWLDPLKLQKQYDFLEANSRYSMCFHNVLVSYENPKFNNHVFKRLERRDYSGDEILKDWIIPTPSVVFRNGLVKIESLINRNYLHGDIILFMNLCDAGNIFCIDDRPGAIYRKHANGITYVKANEMHSFRVINHYLEINRTFKNRYKKICFEKIAQCYLHLSVTKSKKLKISFFLFLLKSLSYDKRLIHNFLVLFLNKKKTLIK